MMKTVLTCLGGVLIGPVAGYFVTYWLSIASSTSSWPLRRETTLVSKRRDIGQSQAACRVRKTNDLLRAEAKTDKRIAFLDGSFDLLLDGGKIRDELFVEDRLDLNDDGYKLWADMLAQHLGLGTSDGE